MDAHHDCSNKHKAQNSAVTSDGFTQNKEQEKMECPRFYKIPNPTDTSKTVQKKGPYEGTVNFMNFQIVRIMTLLFKGTTKYVK